MQNSPSCFICRDSMKITDHRVSMGNERSQLKASLKLLAFGFFLTVLLSKQKWNVLRRDDYCYFHHYSFQICITDKREVNTTGSIHSQTPFFFLHFVRLS